MLAKRADQIICVVIFSALPNPVTIANFIDHSRYVHVGFPDNLLLQNRVSFMGDETFPVGNRESLFQLRSFTENGFSSSFQVAERNRDGRLAKRFIEQLFLEVLPASTNPGKRIPKFGIVLLL